MSTPGPSVPPKKSSKFQPKNTARRSKAERDALEREEAARRKARAEAAAADAAAEAAALRGQYGLSTNDRRGEWRGRGDKRGGRGGRGGFMGSGIITKPGSYANNMRQGNSSSRLGGFGGGGGGGGGSFRGGSGIKREGGIKQDPDGDWSMLGIKPDPDGDSDEDAMGPRMDIDQINLVSDDEGDGGDDDGERATTSRSSRRHVDGSLPIRLQRREHAERTMKINTEASSDASAMLRKAAEATTKAREASNLNEALKKVTRKATKRSKDVEVLGNKRVWKGVWDDDDDDEPAVRIKPEPMDDEPMSMGVEPGTSEFGRALALEQTPEPGVEPDGSVMPEPLEDSKANVRAKLKQRRKVTEKPTMYQTPEEIKEWEKRQEEFASMAEELGRIQIASTIDEPDTETQDRDTSNQRDESVYLFQLPTILPELSEPAVKKEPVSPTFGRKDAPTDQSRAPAEGEVQIKVEEDELKANLDTGRRRKSHLAPGVAGKLHVHKSGRTTLTWGGTNMEMKMGVSPYFLQTAILTQLDKDETPKVDKDGRKIVKPVDKNAPKRKEGVAGQAISFGQVRGKLVVMPAWSDILGERGLA